MTITTTATITMTTAAIAAVRPITDELRTAGTYPIVLLLRRVGWLPVEVSRATLARASFHCQLGTDRPQAALHATLHTVSEEPGGRLPSSETGAPSPA